MTLRLRLSLALLTVALVTGIAAVFVARAQAGIKGQVRRLERTRSERFDEGPWVGRAVEVEGRWNASIGQFEATEIEPLPRSRRPKLRAAIQEVRPETNRWVVLGMPIEWNERTEFPHADAPPGAPADPALELAVGTRAEIACTVEADGRWVARRVETTGIKGNDKLKGTVTAAFLAARGEGRLEIEGLAVRVPRGLQVSEPNGPLFRLECATHMNVSIQECLTAAQELLKEAFREHGQAEPSSSMREASQRMADELESFGYYLDVAQSTLAVDGKRSDGPAVGELERSLDGLQQALPRFGEVVDSLRTAVRADPEGAQRWYESVFAPTLREEILPRLHAFEIEAEDDLSARLDAVSARAATAARSTLVASLAGLVLALATGLALSSSIAKPLVALERAATAIGEGDLAARVHVHSRDELGALASTFNQMADRLSSSTVSVEHLNAVIDSMAGALFLLGPDDRVTSVNPAALDLLGYAREDLLGRPFADLLGEVALAQLERGRSPRAGVAECSLLRHVGGAIPVAFSSATLRDGQGRVLGRVCLAQDLTERKRMEAELRRSLADKELLVREVHHRVKNNLQVISSLLDLQSQGVEDPGSLERFQESQDRIQSMVFIHDQLYRSADLTAIDLRVYLGMLVHSLGESLRDPQRAIELTAQVDDVCVDLDQALACGLIVNELVTNAYKHAFGGLRAGSIQVGCQLQEGGRLRLEVRDDGAGWSLGARQREDSLGMSLVETLVQQLHGTLSTHSAGGAALRIEFQAHLVAGAA